MCKGTVSIVVTNFQLLLTVTSATLGRVKGKVVLGCFPCASNGPNLHTFTVIGHAAESSLSVRYFTGRISKALSHFVKICKKIIYFHMSVIPIESRV